MRALRALFLRVIGLFNRERRDRDLDDEVESSLQMQIEDNLRRGMPPDEARYAALRKFGNVTLVKEEARELWSLTWLEQLWQDVRFGVRMLRKNPGFTAVAIIPLALGIGASTAIFSVVYPVLVNPYPYKGADRMLNFAIVGRTNGDVRDWFSADEFRALRDQNRVFDGLVAFSAFDKVLSGDDLPEVVSVIEMSGDAFRYFGIAPLLGRVFTQRDAPWGKQPAPVAVVSFRFWTRHFAAAQNILGKTIRLDGKSYAIIGVLPQRFAWHSADIYVPNDQSWEYVWIEAWLHPGVSSGQAAADVNLILHQQAKVRPREYPLDEFSIAVQGLKDRTLGQFRESFLLLVAAVGFLLLIACSNIANLQLARGNARETEVGVRASLGASRGRIVRQLLTESVMLALVGGALGVLLAYFGVHLIVSIMPTFGIPPEAVLGVNGLALLFAVVLSVVVGSVSGLAPAIRLARSRMRDSLNRGEKGATRQSNRDRTRSALIAGECAVAMLLLVVAGLTFRNFLSLRATRLGFDPNRILTMNIPIDWGRTSWQARVARLNAILSRVQALPGVQKAALSISTVPPPLAGGLHTEAQSEPSGETHSVHMNLVSPEFFAAFDMPLLQGRVFTNAELETGSHVAVVNRAMARLLWPGVADPVGRQVHLSLELWEVESIGRPPHLNGHCQVVGIVDDVRNDGLQRPAQPSFYIPYSLLVDSEATLTLRSGSNPLLLANAVRSVIASQGNGQPVTDVWRYGDYLETVILSHDRFSAVFFLLFGALGLALCASGIYSVVFFALSRRTHEIGIRMALGAQKRQILRMVIRDTMTPVLIGFGLGLLGAASVSRFIANQLSGVRPTDPLTLGLVSLILGVVALLACYIPARRATKVDPMVALRHE